MFNSFLKFKTVESYENMHNLNLIFSNLIINFLVLYVISLMHLFSFHSNKQILLNSQLFIQFLIEVFD
jgi:hypothetical protein